MQGILAAFLLLGAVQGAAGNPVRYTLPAFETAAAAIGMGTSTGDIFPRPSYPAAAWHTNEQGTVWLQLDFDSEGALRSCEIAKSSAPRDLTDETRDFVRTSWSSRTLAGRQVVIPITYQTIRPVNLHVGKPASTPNNAPAPDLVMTSEGPMLNDAETVMSAVSNREKETAIMVVAPYYPEFMREMQALQNSRTAH